MFCNQNKNRIFAPRFPDVYTQIIILNKFNLRTMTKAEIVNEIAKNTGIDKATVLTTIESFMEAVKDSLSKKDNVYLRGFGSFIIKERAEKKARNISKNTTITIPAHSIPAFRPAKSFTEVVK